MSKLFAANYPPARLIIPSFNMCYIWKGIWQAEEDCTCVLYP